MSGGVLITFEGIEGSGKTTQAKLLEARLSELSFQVVLTREPGGTELAERIRAVLLDGRNSGLTARAETLLMMASRAQLVEELIVPSLRNGKVVIADRYTDSSVAYQGAARGVGRENTKELNQFATGGLQPSLTFLLDVPVDVGLSRIRTGDGKGLDRIESEELQFHKKVREAYLEMAKDEPERIKVIDGNLSVDEVFKEVWSFTTNLSSIGGRL